MAKLKVVIGTNHVGIQYVDELIDTFPEIDFVTAYDPKDHKAVIRDADAFFGWPDGQAFSAARQLKWIACPGMGIDKIVAYQNIVDSDVPITNAPGTHVTSMADHVVGAIDHASYSLIQVRKRCNDESNTSQLTGSRLALFPGPQFDYYRTIHSTF